MEDPKDVYARIRANHEEDQTIFEQFEEANGENGALFYVGLIMTVTEAMTPHLGGLYAAGLINEAQFNNLGADITIAVAKYYSKQIEDGGTIQVMSQEA